jgi:hypothetical protein
MAGRPASAVADINSLAAIIKTTAPARTTFEATWLRSEPNDHRQIAGRR